MKALIIDKISHVIENGLRKFDFLIEKNILPSKKKLIQLLPQFDLLIMRVNPTIDKEVLDAAKGHIKLICVCATGLNHIDVDYAKQCQIVVQNAPGVNSNAVVELTFSKMLDLSRMTMDANKEVQEEGIWDKYKYTGHELKGHVLGIIGLGKIGKGIARLAHAFGMKVLAYDPYIPDDDFSMVEAQKCNCLEELLKDSDYITIHTPINNETRGMIGENQFKLMKKTAYLINCARGGIIDENVAAEYLKSGKIAGIGVDVIKDELARKELKTQNPLNSPFFKLNHCIVSPHIAGSTYEGLDAIGVYILNKILKFYNLKVDKE